MSGCSRTCTHVHPSCVCMCVYVCLGLGRARGALLHLRGEYNTKQVTRNIGAHVSERRRQHWVSSDKRRDGSPDCSCVHFGTTSLVHCSGVMHACTSTCYSTHILVGGKQGKLMGQRDETSEHVVCMHTCTLLLLRITYVLLDVLWNKNAARFVCTSKLVCMLRVYVQAALPVGVFFSCGGAGQHGGSEARPKQDGRLAPVALSR